MMDHNEQKQNFKIIISELNYFVGNQNKSCQSEMYENGRIILKKKYVNYVNYFVSREWEKNTTKIITLH